MTEPEVYLTWCDDGIYVVCERASCATQATTETGHATSWAGEILPYKLTPEQAQAAVDEHVQSVLHRAATVAGAVEDGIMGLLRHFGVESQVVYTKDPDGKIVVLAGNAEAVPREQEAVADVLAKWGVRSHHGEWSDREAQMDAAREILRTLREGPR